MNPQISHVIYPPIELVKKIRTNVGSVKMLPDVAIRALDIARDPDSTVQEFASVVQQDLKLATDVLGMANSVLYSAGRPIASLEQAIARIGFRQTKNLVITSSLSSVMKKMPLEEQWIRDVLWKHSVITAVIATHLNRSLQLKLAGEEFTAGLVHDFGRTLLAAAIPEKFPEIDPLDFDETQDVLDQEHAAIGSNHCELGGWFALDLGLPDVLCEVIRFHHTLEVSTSCPRLVAVTATADHMANHYQRAGDLQGYSPAENPGPMWLQKAGVQDAGNRFQLVCAEVFEKAISDADDLIELV